MNKVVFLILLLIFFCAPLCSADEITTKKGDKVEGSVEGITRKRLILATKGVGKVYWIKDLQAISIGDAHTGGVLTYTIGDAKSTDDIILPPPSYKAPELNYAPSVVETVVSGCEVKLSSGQTIEYYGLKVPDDALARAVNKALCEKKKVDVHTLKEGKAIVICDGVCVNAKLIEEGMALADKEIGEEKLKVLFAALETYAYALDKGRWGLDTEAGRKVLSDYLSPKEISEREVLAYNVKGDTIQAIDWREVPLRPPGLPFASLKGCTVIVGGSGPRKAWVPGSSKTSTSTAPKAKQASGQGKSAPQSSSSSSSSRGSSKSSAPGQK